MARSANLDDEVLPAEKEIPLVEVITRYAGTEFLRLVKYPIMVERWPRMWAYIGGRTKLVGRLGREFAKTFTEVEQATLAEWYHRFYKWHIHTGTPLRVEVNTVELALLMRAVRFFAEN